jgi:hypothetical protein
MEHTRPCVLGLANDNRVGVPRSFLSKSRRVRTADHHREAASPEFSREPICMQSGRRRGSDSYEVRRHVESHRLDNLIRMRDHMLRWSERRNQRHRQLWELNQA